MLLICFTSSGNQQLHVSMYKVKWIAEQLISANEALYGHAGRVHVFRVCLAVSLGIATVMLMDATNTFYFAWFR